MFVYERNILLDCSNRLNANAFRLQVGEKLRALAGFPENVEMDFSARPRSNERTTQRSGNGPTAVMRHMIYYQ
jgi:hypothetical protein